MRQRQLFPGRLPGIPEWEATKGNSRNLTHGDAAAECAYLSDQYRRMWRPMSTVHVELQAIVQTLRAKKIPFVVTGMYGIAGWLGRPRATHDVDLLVKSGRNHARAVKALKALYPQLEIRSSFGVTSFFIPGEKEPVIDITYPHRADNAETLRTAVWEDEKTKNYKIPDLEAALANKYGAMLTLSRNPAKRVQDLADFLQMVQHSQDEGRRPIDLERLAALGELVWPGGGGEEIVRLVEEVKAGKPPDLVSLLRRGRD